MGFNPAGGGISGANDVAISNVVDNQVLVYDSITQLWRNENNAGNATSAMVNANDIGVLTTNTGENNRTSFNSWTAANPGVPIFIPAGTYDFSGGALSPKGSMFGAGHATVLRFPEMDVSCIYAIFVDNIKLADFKILSTSTDQGVNSSSSNGITLDTSTNFQISNVEVNGKVVMGIHVRVSHRGSVIGCRVYGTAYDGIHVTGGSTDVSVVGNEMVNTGDDGIAVIAYNEDSAQSERIAITGNTVKNVGHARGITIEGGKDVSVTGNVIQQTASNGILVNSIGSALTDTFTTSNVIIANNIISSANGDGIHINGKNSGVVLRGNKITSPASAGVRLLMGRVVMDGNIIDDAGDTGIAADGGNNAPSAETVIINNVIRRSQKGGLYCAVSKVTFSGNVIQEPSQNGAPVAGALFYNCNDLMITNNRIDATNSTLTPQGIFVSVVTGALIALNYAPGAGVAVGNNSSTGIVTS